MPSKKDRARMPEANQPIVSGDDTDEDPEADILSRYGLNDDWEAPAGRTRAPLRRFRPKRSVQDWEE